MFVRQLHLTRVFLFRATQPPEVPQERPPLLLDSLRRCVHRGALSLKCVLIEGTLVVGGKEAGRVESVL